MTFNYKLSKKAIQLKQWVLGRGNWSDILWANSQSQLMGLYTTEAALHLPTSVAPSVDFKLRLDTLSTRCPDPSSPVATVFNISFDEGWHWLTGIKSRLFEQVNNQCAVKKYRKDTK